LTFRGFSQNHPGLATVDTLQQGFPALAGRFSHNEKQRDLTSIEEVCHYSKPTRA
jgi:hypothetical protein